MRILFAHQNFPGQFHLLSGALAASPDNEVLALAHSSRSAPAGVRVQRYKMPRPKVEGLHPLLRRIERNVHYAEAAAYASVHLKRQGFQPDVICGHTGWSETLFLRDVWPDAKVIAYQEYFYKTEGSDVGFDPEYTNAQIESPWRLRLSNSLALAALDASDWAVTPTEWQRSQIPDAYRAHSTVVHEGIDTDKLRPNPEATIKLGRLAEHSRPGDEIITFVNRNLEPVRGFHVFMRALPEILRRRPNARVVMVGGNEVSYGTPAPNGGSYKDLMLKEVGKDLDMSRVHFVGKLPYDVYVQLLQVSAAHVYFTYPFILSWSMLEAMSAGCLVIGSNTAPVTEVLEHGKNGLIVDFFDVKGLSDTVVAALEAPERYKELRVAARQTILDTYDFKRICLPAHRALIDAVLAGETPPARYDPAVLTGAGGNTATDATLLRSLEG